MSTRTSTRSPRGSTPRIPVFAIVVGVVVVLGIVAVALVALSGSDDGDANDTSGPQTAPVEVTGTPLAPYEGGTDTEIGSPAPELSGVDFAQSPSTVEANGRPTALAFLAHWCSHCQREVPRLAAFVNGAGVPEGVDLVLVPTATSSTDPNYPPEPWLVDAGLGDVPTLVDSDESTALVAMGGGPFPFWVFLDAEHNVAGRLAGELPEGAFEVIFAALERGDPITPELVGLS